MREGAQEGARPKLGRPAKTLQVSENDSDASGSEDVQINTDAKVNKSRGFANSGGERENFVDKEGPAKIQTAETTRQVRSTRNPHPKYVDAIWTASQREINEINRAINGLSF